MSTSCRLGPVFEDDDARAESLRLGQVQASLGDLLPEQAPARPEDHGVELEAVEVLERLLSPTRGPLPSTSMDLNWIYSSIAQSAAAIVGVIGGFLVSGQIRQREEAELTSRRHQSRNRRRSP